MYEALVKELEKNSSERRAYNMIQIELAKRYFKRVGQEGTETRNKMMEDWIRKYSTKFRGILDANVRKNANTPDNDFTSIYLKAGKNEEEKEEIFKEIEELLYTE